MGQSGRMKALKRCLQVLEQCSRRQQNAHVARLITLVLGRNEIKLHQSHLGKTEPFEGVIEPRLEKIEPLLGIKVNTHTHTGNFVVLFEPKVIIQFWMVTL